MTPAILSMENLFVEKTLTVNAQLLCCHDIANTGIYGRYKLEMACL